MEQGNPESLTHIFVKAIDLTNPTSQFLSLNSFKHYKPNSNIKRKARFSVPYSPKNLKDCKILWLNVSPKPKTKATITEEEEQKEMTKAGANLPKASITDPIWHSQFQPAKLVDMILVKKCGRSKEL